MEYLSIFIRVALLALGQSLDCHSASEVSLIDMGKSVNVYTVYPKKYAHGFVELCFVVVMQSFIMNSHGVFIHIHQGCFAGTGAIVRLPQCQWSKPDGYGKISQCITTTKHSKTKTVCIFLGIYCSFNSSPPSATYMCRWIGSALVQIMACRIFGTRPLSINHCWIIVNWSLRIKVQWFF